jgi:RNA polymerase sigma factor (sigma-70 family)
MARGREVPDLEAPIDLDGMLVIRAAVEQLPPRQRRVVVLRYAHDLSIREIARREGIAGGTVRDALERARARLRRRLAEA